MKKEQQAECLNIIDENGNIIPKKDFLAASE